jgi:transmembrane 9 superfamily protein 2/4
MDAQEDVQEDSGWKLVHGDVFRPPKHTLLLSVLLGSGAQLFMMVGVTTGLSTIECDLFFSFCDVGISFAK